MSSFSHLFTLIFQNMQQLQMHPKLLAKQLHFDFSNQSKRN